MRTKVLLTGATGFIGSHLVKDLCQKEWRVCCLLREKSRPDRLEGLPVEIRQGPLDDPEFLGSAVEGQDLIFHLAARIRSAPKSVYNKANHILTRDLIKSCLHRNPDVKRFVYVSSIAAGGPTPAGLCIDETRPPAPSSEYGRTKLRGEDAVRQVWDRIPATIVRPPNVYGPGQQETEFLLKLMHHRIVPVLKRRPPNTSLIYVQDLNRGLIQAALSEKAVGQIYYLTDGKKYSWRDLLTAMKTDLIGNAPFMALPEGLITGLAAFTDLLKRLGLVHIMFGHRSWRTMIETPWLFSSLKAERDFDFKASFPLEIGMAETVLAFLNRRSANPTSL